MTKISTPSGAGYATGPVAITDSAVTAHTNPQRYTQSVYGWVHANNGATTSVVTVVWGGVTLSKNMAAGESWPIGPMPLGPDLAITIAAAAADTGIRASFEVRGRDDVVGG